MEKIYYPDSVVIIGLSSKPNNIPRLTLENLLRWGYRGRIFGVNLRSEDTHVDGIRMYRNIEDLPEVPDLAYCMIPAPYIPDMVERCGKFGIKRMAIPSGGFAEYSEEGEQLSDKTMRSARKYGMRIVGPNGLTVANTENGLCFPFVSLHKAPQGGMSIISQSGGVALTIMNFFLDENLGMAKLASIGNKLDLDEVDFLEYFGEDPQTKVICMYLESLDRGREFIETARKIDKPVIVLKTNTTEAGKRLAMSHTAAVSNDEDIINSAFEEAGVIRARKFMDFIEITKAFQLPPMRGPRIVAMSPAGGFSVMSADLCEEAGFEFAELGDDFYESLKQFSNAGVINFSNPLDMGDIYDPQFTAHVIYSVMHSEQVDGAIYISQRPQMPQGDNVFHRLFLADLSKETWGSILSSGKPMGVSLFGPTNMIQKTKRSVEFPIFNSPEDLVFALSQQMRFYRSKERLRSIEGAREDTPGVDRAKAREWLQEKSGDYGEEVLDLLSTYGIPAAGSEVVSSPEAAVNCAEKLGYPVVMKLVSPDALHKSDVGGVMVGVKDAGEVEESFQQIRENLEHYHPGGRFTGVRVQQMAGDGYDMFVGGKQDPSFGAVVFFGMGGVFVEVFRDVANILCPSEEESIRSRLERLQSYKILQGQRGQEPGDVEALVDLIKRVSQLMADFPSIKELDLNPVRVFSRENGVLSLDARARITVDS